MDNSTENSPVVLVVDDEEAIREAVRDILELVEIPSILAANGREAIDLFVQNRNRIKAILLDLRMPIMSGTKTYEKLRELDARNEFDVYINICEGYEVGEEWAYQGIDVVNALEELNLPYTGATPWFFDPSREEMQAAADARVRTLHGRGMTDATLYDASRTSVGGIHSLFVLRGDPEDFNLPANPVVPVTLLATGWTSAGIASLGMVAAVTAALRWFGN